MNDQQTKLIEQLAQKLGTTTEYLWGVLVRQAFIDSIGSLFQMAIIVLYGIILYRLHKRFIKEEKIEGSYNAFQNTYYRYESTIYIMFLGLVIFIILAFIAFFAIGDVINGFINPEYWALEKVLRIIK